MHLFLMRHGQASNNVQAQPAPAPRVGEHELTPLGREQALAFARWARRPADAPPAGVNKSPGACETLLRRAPFKRALASPMLRALQTVEAVREPLNLSCEVLVELHEWGGPSELDTPGATRVTRGQTCTQLRASFPSMAFSSALTTEGWWGGGPREDCEGCWRRGEKLVPALLDRAREENLLLVTHAWFANVLARVLAGQENSPLWWETEWRELCHTGWCAWDVSRLPAAPAVWNCVEHLRPEQRTT